MAEITRSKGIVKIADTYYPVNPPRSQRSIYQSGSQTSRVHSRGRAGYNIINHQPSRAPTPPFRPQSQTSRWTASRLQQCTPPQGYYDFAKKVCIRASDNVPPKPLPPLSVRHHGYSLHPGRILLRNGKAYRDLMAASMGYGSKHPFYFDNIYDDVSSIYQDVEMFKKFSS
mmetsp:Transcript_9595/g.13974  ORF Transcript_9595/g.13974 Transcript_9595/m.13974 type:complete len:171 (+) Transcript_9595:28-540(+)|eukprot:CAMPEP_0175094592 /NCGR_PEP_ID=MMETSP0086_2-20121207/3676_1 /TAXON_ID=136419 /ORGANISM="Unknown Unknown, Strain D1" /LENGTH=170 /DNA_ID=CAMNT_0016367727 /DNA_START=25 /DNA_END=537 /DNA_ORIENTATION=-